MSDVSGHRVDVNGWQPLTESDIHEQLPTQMTYSSDLCIFVMLSGKTPVRCLLLGSALYSLPL